MASRLLCGSQTIFLFLVIPLALPAVEPAQWAESHVDGLIPLYKHLHSNPELSLQEVETSKIMAKELEAAGLRVTTNVGGYGVVGVLENVWRERGKTLIVVTHDSAVAARAPRLLRLHEGRLAEDVRQHGNGFDQSP